MQSIENELLERLKKGVYGDIYNYPVKQYNKVLEMEELQLVGEQEEDEEVFLQNSFSSIIAVKMWSLCLIAYMDICIIILVQTKCRSPR